MPLSTHTFEQSIDDHILERSLELCQKAAVTERPSKDKDSYLAKVKDRKEHLLILRIKDDRIIGHLCDCPAGKESFCAHKVAYLFYLQRERFSELLGPKVMEKLNAQSGQGEEKIEESPKKVRRKKAPPITKDPEAELTALLAPVQAETLRDILIELALEDKILRDTLHLRFSDKQPKGERREFSKQVTAIIKPFKSGRYVHYRQSIGLAKALHPLVDHTEEAVMNGAAHLAFVQSTVLMERLHGVMTQGDDSGGHLSQLMSRSRQLLRECVAQADTPKLRKEMLVYLLKLYGSGKLKGWDWHNDLIENAIGLVDAKAEANKIHSLLDRMEDEEEDYERRYDLPTYWQAGTDGLEGTKEVRYLSHGRRMLQFARLRLYLAMEENEQAMHYINDHLNNEDIRSHAIEQAIDSGDLVRAEKLAQEGFRSSRHGREKWAEFLITIARSQGDIAKEIEYLRWMVVSVPRISHSRDIERLRKRVPAKDWKKMRDGLIADFEKDNTHRSSRQHMELLIQEGLWKKLVPQLQRHLNVKGLRELEPRLLPQMREELILLYEKLAMQQARSMREKKSYQYYCKILKNIERLGDHARFQRLIEEARKDNPRRPSLLHELDRIGG